MVLWSKSTLGIYKKDTRITAYHVLVLLGETGVVTCESIQNCQFHLPLSDRGISVHAHAAEARVEHRDIEYVPAAIELAIDSYFGHWVPVLPQEGSQLTSDELEGLGLEDRVGVSFRNGHFCAE